MRGVVQGVGFRPWVCREARALGLAGRVRNDGAGVEIEAFGPPAALGALRARLAAPPLAAARVEAVEVAPIGGAAPAQFAIVPSDGSAAHGVFSVAPDLATCDDCLRELSDPGDRRHRWPFVTCAECGPRFTIVRALPYDRERTSMDAFPPCPRCAREYADPADRRFHAETISCPDCGPCLRLLAADGRVLAEREEALAEAVRGLRAGGLVAVQGLGGFHLACDASNEIALRELRTRKQRERRPFAVMVRDLAEAERLAVLSPEERALLASPERPIVLVRRREGARLAARVAPDSPCVGLLLAYTPLHHLLLQAFGRPIVLTSGNRSGEPIAHRLADALAQLEKIADVFLAHDREITVGCDDSVARVIAGAPVVLRRSRGFVPRPIRLATSVRRPVLACGGQLQNTFCVAVGERAYLSRHHGDLDAAEAAAAFERGIEETCARLGVVPEVIAHDLHPLYHATLHALARPERTKIAVQHHHAHVASALAEHGVEGPALGLAWDGTGYGGDGTAWGGELLLAERAHFQRLGTFRPIRLAGGERAIREPWRLALALVDDAFDGAPPLGGLALFDALPAERVEQVHDLLRRDVACVPAHGVGRLFDAVGALVLRRPLSRFQGEVAMACNFVAAAERVEPFPFDLDRSTAPRQIDPRPMVRALVEGLRAGAPAPLLSARFHATLAEAAASLLREATRAHGALPVVLTGGCFQNALLTERVLERLGSATRVLRHREVPPGDGGLALGQAVVADAIASRGED